MSLLQRAQAAFDAIRGKQISHRPDLAGRVHIWSSMSNAADIDLQSYQDWANVYKRYVWASKCVSKTAQALASKTVRVVDDEGEAIDNHPLTELLARVNDVQSSAEIWTSYFVNMLIAGESAFEIVDAANGQPSEIWDRRPDLLEVVPDEERAILFPKPIGYRWPRDSQSLIPPENLWHNKFFNPLNVWRGLAPIEAVRQGVVIDIFAQSWSKNFLKGGARPDYAIIAPEGTTKDEREMYEQQIMDRYSGSDNWHRPMVLEDGVIDIKELNFPPKDIAWLDQRKMSRDEVAAVFGMPDEIAGFGRDTYENFDTAWRVWWLLTLKPLSDHRDNSLQSFFTRIRPILRPGEFIQTDLTDVGALQEDLEPKVKIAQRLFRMGVPFNILDERLGLGIGPIATGDESYVSISGQGLVPESDTEQAAVPPPTAKTKAVPAHIIDQIRRFAHVAIDRGKSPKVMFFDPHIRRQDSYKIATVLGLCRSKAEIDLTLSHLDHYIPKVVIGDEEDVPESRTRDEREFRPQMETFLLEESERVFSQISTFDPAPPDPDFWRAEIVLAGAFLAPFVLQWAENGVGQGAEILNAVAIGLDAEANIAAANWANQYSLDLAKGLTGTTRELTKTKITNFIESGRPIQELQDELAQVIGPEWRARLIARTEVTNAWAEGTLIAGQETDAVKGLIWQTSLQENVCPICAPLEGKRAAKKNGSFALFPGGFRSPTAHPGCYCFLAYDV